MSTSDKEQSGEGEAECLDHGVPSQWPLFDAPVLSSVRVTGFTENSGTVVSVCVCVCVNRCMGEGWKRKWFYAQLFELQL